MRAVASKLRNQPRAAIPTQGYLVQRNDLIAEQIRRVRGGEDIVSVLSGFPAKVFDERTAEYAYFVWWLLTQAEEKSLLDVGCVLNNKAVSAILRDRCTSIWFCNAALEPVVIENPVYYHVSTLENSFPSGQRFPLVTCLSTIEHVGYDNSQYGTKSVPEYTETTVEPLVSSVEHLTRITARPGNLLISVPFGFREVLIHPKTGRVASQVFDSEAMQEGVRTLEHAGFSAKLEVFAAKNDGWHRTDPEGCQARYADGCPAAGAVAFLSGYAEGEIP